jgi:23S rRNA pseudouridine2604 synthase
MEKIIYPIRLNRYLALNGYCSRRESDVLIAKNIVFVNGQVAKIGTKIEEKDLVEVDLESRKAVKEYVYFAYNKPRGLMTNNDQIGEKSIKDILHLPKDVFPVGRLDKDSHGLILLSNDGRINSRLLSPEYDHAKEYLVTVNKPITNHFLNILRRGVNLEGFQTKECIAEKIDDYKFKIILTEGKKHQIRRMCDNLGYTTQELERVRIMNITLGDLKSGQTRKIKGEELEELLKSLGIEE